MSSETQAFGPPPKSTATEKGLPKTEIVEPPKQTTPKSPPPVKPVKVKPSASEISRRKTINDALNRKAKETEATQAIIDGLAQSLGIDSKSGPQDQTRLASNFRGVVDPSEYSFLLDVGFDDKAIVRGIVQSVRRQRLRGEAGTSSDLKQAKQAADEAEKTLAKQRPILEKKIAAIQTEIDKLQADIQPKLGKYRAMLGARKALLACSPEAVKRAHDHAKRQIVEPINHRIGKILREINRIECTSGLSDLKVMTLSKDEPVFKNIKHPSIPKSDPCTLPTLGQYRLQNEPKLLELQGEIARLKKERDDEIDKIDSEFQDY